MPIISVSGGLARGHGAQWWLLPAAVARRHLFAPRPSGRGPVPGTGVGCAGVPPSASSAYRNCASATGDSLNRLTRPKRGKFHTWACSTGTASLGMPRMPLFRRHSERRMDRKASGERQVNQEDLWVCRVGHNCDAAGVKARQHERRDRASLRELQSPPHDEASEQRKRKQRHAMMSHVLVGAVGDLLPGLGHG